MTEPRIILEQFSQSDNVALGVMFECAVDNAGLDGQHLHNMSDDQVGDVLYGLRFIIDGRGINFPSDDEWAQARALAEF